MSKTAKEYEEEAKRWRIPMICFIIAAICQTIALCSSLSETYEIREKHEPSKTQTDK